MKKLFSLLFLGVISIYCAVAGETTQNNVPQATTATLTGLVWYDENSNGIQDEVNKGIAKIRVHLLKDGEDTGEMVETDVNGTYLFDNLEGDHNYSIKVDKPKNYPYFTLQNEGDDDTKDSDIYYKDGTSDAVLLKAGDCYSDLDAGLLCVCKGAIRVEKSTNSEDADKPEDAVILKVGDVVTWEYEIENPSNLKVCNIKLVDDKEGNIECPNNCLDAHTSMTCIKTGIAKEGNYTNEATVSGVVEDNNNTVIDKDTSNYFGGNPKIAIIKYIHGYKNSNETPILGVGDSIQWDYEVTNIGNVKLTNIVVTDDKEGVVDCPKDTLEPSQSMTCIKKGTVKEGNYTNIATVKSQWETQEVAVAGTSQTSSYQGKSACLGNFMWLDENLNGVQDEGEPGIIDIKVELYDANGTLLKTTKTDKNGKYLFCGLKPGSYKVKFEQPNTYLFTFKDKGSDLKDSDVDKKGWTQTIVIKPGETNLTVDAGVYCECDDSKVNPQDYKKLSANLSFGGFAIMLIFIFIATSSLRYKEGK